MATDPEKYPEHAKFDKFKEGELSAINEFLEYLDSQNIHLAQFAGDGTPVMGSISPERRRNIVEEFVGVDPDELEREKRQMLDELKQMNGTK